MIDEINRRRFIGGALAGVGTLVPAMAKSAEKKGFRLGWIDMEGHYKYTLDPLPEMSNVKLVAAAVPEPSQKANRNKFNSLPKGIKIYTDYREMLEKESLDIAAVYTQHGDTAETLIRCAKKGLHIYTEKPLTTNLKDLERVKKAVDEAGVVLTMMLNMRFDGHYRKVREIVQSGVIGEVTLATAQKSYKLGTRPDWVKSRESFAGTIPYIACHALDIIRWTTGLRFVKGSAFHNNVGRPELGAMENTANMILLAESGATVSIRLDYCRPDIASTWGDDRLRIAGTKGVVEVIGEKVTLITETKKTHEVEPSESVSQFKNMVAAIEGKEELILSTEDAFRITELVLKLRNAADSQTMVVF